MSRPTKVIRACLLAVASMSAAGAPAQSGDPKTLEAWLKSTRRAEERLADQWTVQAKDLDTGAIVFEYNADKRLIPASNRKLVAFALAAEALGPDFKFVTELGHTGGLDRETGIIGGSAILRSNGDPTMSRRYLSQKNPVTVLRGWVGAMASSGIKGIEGDLIVDASAFGWDQDMYPEAWEESYRTHAYAARPSAIAVNGNLLRITVKAGGAVGSPGVISIYPSKEGIGVVNRTSTRSGRRGAIDARFGEDQRTLIISGSIGRGASAEVVSLPLPRPLDYVARILADAVASEGIELQGDVKIITDPEKGRGFVPTRIVARHESIELAELLKVMMRDSDNFLAEQMLRAASHRALGEGSLNAARRFEQIWYNKHNLSFAQPGYDGSGLSRRNRVSAGEMVAVVEAIYDSPARDLLMGSLPVSGLSGTLKRQLGEVSGRVLAKTGTLNDVSALSGFVRDRRGAARWSFSIIGNASKKSNGRLTTRRNQFIKVLVRLLDSGHQPEATGPRPSRLRGPRVKRYRPGTKVYVGRES